MSGLDGRSTRLECPRCPDDGAQLQRERRGDEPALTCPRCSTSWPTERWIELGTLQPGRGRRLGAAFESPDPVGVRQRTTAVLDSARRDPATGEYERVGDVLSRLGQGRPRPFAAEDYLDDRRRGHRG